ncbi:MAG: hypothetical protein GY940_27845 [bacterium]|nr:hypothetical protein [bacterium]
MMLPFYLPSKLMPRANYTDKPFSTRAVVLDSRIGTVKENQVRHYSGSILWSVGEVSLGGYDTGFETNSALLFRQFWPEAPYKTLKKSPQHSWKHLTDFWAIPGPGKFLIPSGGEYRVRENMLRKLELLGVDRIYSDYDIRGLKKNGTLGIYNRYHIGLNSPVQFIEDCNIPDVRKFLVSPSSRETPFDMEITSLKPSEIITGGQSIRIKLPMGNGVIVVPFLLDGYFKFRIDNQPVVPASNVLVTSPITLVKVREGMKELTIEPDVSALTRWRNIGLTAGILLIVIIVAIERRKWLLSGLARYGYRSDHAKNLEEHQNPGRFDQ